MELNANYISFGFSELGGLGLDKRFSGRKWGKKNIFDEK
jgi:hypothetical protein